MFKLNRSIISNSKFFGVNASRREFSSLYRLTKLIGSNARISSFNYRSFHSNPYFRSNSQLNSNEEEIQREEMEFDVVIVGAGPSGLSTAIRLKQLKPELEVCILEKGSYVGAHILSGACIETRSLAELFPDWKERGAPLRVEAKHDYIKFLTSSSAIPLPVIPQMTNHGNYIISLGELCGWLAEQAEQLGVQIFPGFPADKFITEIDEKTGLERVSGVITKDMGIGKDGNPKDTFEPGMILKAKHTVFSEGCRGSLTKQLFSKFNLRENCDKQTYALGVKEVWEVDNEHHKPGTVIHTMGWPLSTDTYGGSFIYHLDEGKINIGFVVALDYKNPTLSPYEELQRFKSHPFVKKFFENGKCISYGARTLSEGGYFSIPKISFPGGIVVGDSAGTLNVPKIKGVHTSMKSGIIGAEAILDALENDKIEANTFREKFDASWLGQELYKERNIRNYFKWGLVPGTLLSGIDSILFRGKTPWNVHGDGKEDYEHCKPINQVTPIQYPKKDNKISFELLTDLVRSNTNHDHDQPSHLKVLNDKKPIDVNLNIYGPRSMNFCPAGVYEFVDDESTESKKRFQINAQNCLHCKACDIKDPNINWTVPNGGEGPSYSNM